MPELQKINERIFILDILLIVTDYKWLCLPLQVACQTLWTPSNCATKDNQVLEVLRPV